MHFIYAFSGLDVLLLFVNGDNRGRAQPTTSAHTLYYTLESQVACDQLKYALQLQFSGAAAAALLLFAAKRAIVMDCRKYGKYNRKALGWTAIYCAHSSFILKP